MKKGVIAGAAKPNDVAARPRADSLHPARTPPGPPLIQRKVDPVAERRAQQSGRGAHPELRIFRPTISRPTVIQAFQAWNDPTKNAFATAFLAHARGLAPATVDNPGALDLVAQHIVPAADLNCAAVEDPGAPANFNYATNSNSPTPANIAAHATGRGFTRINNPEPRLHAEMRIYQNNPAVAYIGISKRCCLLCATALAVVAGVGTRGCHGEIFDTGWNMPPFIKGNAGNLAAFLGPAALLIYNLLSPASQTLALHLIETNVKQYD